MKAVVIKTTGSIYPVTLTKPLHRSAGAIVNDQIEVVRPINLKRPYVLICAESGRLKDMPLNLVASYLYGTHHHGNPIVGDVIIMRENGVDLVGLEDLELLRIQSQMSGLWDLLYQLEMEAQEEEDAERYWNEADHGEEE